MAHLQKRNGRWQARYRGPDSRERTRTFDRKVDGERWLAAIETEKARGQWVDPAAGRVTFDRWFAEWLAGVTVRPTTRSNYEYIGRCYLSPAFGRTELAKMTTATVRRWLAEMRAKELSPNTVAKSYRLLSQVMAVAVEDGIIGRSPCTIKKAGTERSPEMRFATVPQVHDLAAAAPEHARALILTAAFAGLRWGELAGLRRRRVDLLRKTITVAEQITEVNSKLTVAPVKTKAGERVVALPAFLAAELEGHLQRWAEPGPDGLIFPGSEGGPMRRSNFRRRVWAPTLRAAGLEGLRFHDLRHSAGTMTAVAGATTKEIMARLGHSSPRAALVYQHATAERDTAIAAALDVLADSLRTEPVAEVVPIRQAGS